MVCAFYTHTCFNQREREREKGAPGVHWRLNDLLKGEICTTGQIGFWINLFRLRNWVHISGYFVFSEDTWRKCDPVTLQMVNMITFQKIILLNPLATCFQSAGALCVFIIQIHIIHTCVYMSLNGSWCHVL